MDILKEIDNFKKILEYNGSEFLLVGIALAVLSLVLFQTNKNKTYSLLILTGAALMIKLFAIQIDPFLNQWDEQFHALVAKNMIENPLKPMLFKNPVLEYDEFAWWGNHVWLHKQPLFLWQIMLSIKLFGTNIIAVRLPSAILTSLLIPIVYRSGKILVNSWTGYIAACLVCFSHILFELTSGNLNTDHNDASFVFYISLSIWSWLEYERTSGKRKLLFLLLIGLSSGGAVLTKWLTGLLVYSGWGLSVLFSKSRRLKLSSYLDLAKAFGITLLVFLPWQIYISIIYPELSKHEYEYNSRHIFEVIEGHSGGLMWHFERTQDLYGLHWSIILLALVLLLIRLKSSTHKIAVGTFVLIIYLVFTVAATKMIAFTFSVCMLIFISLASFTDLIIKIANKGAIPNWLSQVRLILSLTLIVLISYHQINFDLIKQRHQTFSWEHTPHNFLKIKDAEFIQNIDKTIRNPKNTVIFNFVQMDHIQAMFFNEILAAYDRIPTETDIETLRKIGIEIAVIERNNHSDEVFNNTDIKIIEVKN